MRHRLAGLAWGIGFLLLLGCAGKGEIIPIQVQPTLPGTEKAVKSVDHLRVAVQSFEDARVTKGRLGVRTHLWGGESYFDVPGGKPGEAAAQALADYLGARGWHVLKQGATDGADVVLSGQVLELAVHAKSGVGFTKITTDTKLAFQAQNTADGSLVRLTLSGAGSDSVFWFDPEDAQALLNDVLADSFAKLVRDTKVEQNRLLLR